RHRRGVGQRTGGAGGGRDACCEHQGVRGGVAESLAGPLAGPVWWRGAALHQHLYPDRIGMSVFDGKASSQTRPVFQRRDDRRGVIGGFHEYEISSLRLLDGADEESWGQPII